MFDFPLLSETDLRSASSWLIGRWGRVRCGWFRFGEVQPHTEQHSLLTAFKEVGRGMQVKWLKVREE